MSAPTNPTKNRRLWICEKIELLLSIPKSFWVCTKLFGLKRAFRLPLILKYNTIILSIEGSVNIKRSGRIKIGFGTIAAFDTSRERSIIMFDGEITIAAPCHFGPGCKIISEKGSKLNIDHHFDNTAKLTISNRGIINIGSNCLVSWNTWICDTAYHQIIDLNTNSLSNVNGIVNIGDQVWIGANSSVIKGAIIPNGSIVATGAIVNKKFTEQNSLLVGVPAMIKRKNVSWRIK